MTLFHYKNVWMLNVTNFISIFGMEQVGFWTMDGLKISWDDSVCRLISKEMFLKKLP